MANDIKIWEIDDSSPLRPQLLESTTGVKTEKFLEDLLVEKPEMLMPGLWLVGRQTRADSGFADLLGVTEDGRLVVFELKRGKLTREAVAQVVDYCSYLESLTEDDLAAHIADHSGKGRIAKIDDFEARYREHVVGEELESLRPVRMVLVGLGADDAARRMVDFLASRGVDISLLTFHGWRHGTNTLLARQIESIDVRDTGRKSHPDEAERREALDKLAENLGIGPLWRNAVDALNVTWGNSPKQKWITFYDRRIMLSDGTRHHASHSVGITGDGKIRIVFYPASVHLCPEQFEGAKSAIPLDSEQPRNTFPTELAPEQLYCVLDGERWEEHRDRLVGLARAVRKAWDAARNGEVSA